MSDDGPEVLAPLGVSRETIERLFTHRALLETWNARMNLVGPRELGHYWSRHVLDSAQLLRLAPPDAVRWADLGTGAGFPGLVIAAALADREGALVRLIEKSPKKATFLREAVRAMAVPAVVVNAMVEDAPSDGVQVVTARAFAPLPRLIEHARRFFDQGAVGLFPKGTDHVAELTAAGFTPDGGAFLQGSMRAEALESMSNPAGRVLRIWREPR
jgi:16S rRNA (guanine527-N7)-methyltransferase